MRKANIDVVKCYQYTTEPVFGEAGISIEVIKREEIHSSRIASSNCRGLSTR
jgi:hypothetical protein